MKPGYVEILDPNFTIWEKFSVIFAVTFGFIETLLMAFLMKFAGVTYSPIR